LKWNKKRNRKIKLALEKWNFLMMIKIIALIRISLGLYLQKVKKKGKKNLIPHQRILRQTKQNKSLQSRKKHQNKESLLISALIKTKKFFKKILTFGTDTDKYILKAYNFY
jgi:hypothetical protein